MPLAKPLRSLSRLPFKIVRSRPNGNLYGFHLGHMAFRMAFRGLSLLVKEFTIVENFCNRRNRLRPNLYEIKAFLLGNRPCALKRHESQILSFWTDKLKFADAYLPIDAFFLL